MFAGLDKEASETVPLWPVGRRIEGGREADEVDKDKEQFKLKPLILLASIWRLKASNSGLASKGTC